MLVDAKRLTSAYPACYYFTVCRHRADLSTLMRCSGRSRRTTILHRSYLSSAQPVVFMGLEVGRFAAPLPSICTLTVGRKVLPWEEEMIVRLHGSRPKRDTFTKRLITAFG